MLSRFTGPPDQESLDGAPNPRMVSLARDYRGITQTDLAKLVGVKQGLISKIEAGIAGISDEMLDDLSHELYLPRRFFYQSNKVYGLGSHAYAYRRRQRMSARHRKRIEAQVNLLRFHADRMLQSLDIHAPLRIPNIPIADSDSSPEQIAGTVRAMWLIPSGPIHDVTAILEDAGIVVIPCDFGTMSMDATSIWLTGKNPLVFINKDVPGDRWRYTLCHELGHLVMHNEPSDYMEREADQFAAAMLMPESDVAPDLSNVTLKHLARIKPYWKVSIQALLERAYSIERITGNQRRYFYINLSKHGYRTREPAPLERETPRLHRRLLDVHTNELGYTLDDLARLFSLHPQQVGELYFSATPSLRVVN